MLSFWFGLNRQAGLDLNQDKVWFLTSKDSKPGSIPALAARNRRNQSVVAIGEEAEKMRGKTPPELEVVRVISRGRLTDIELAGQVIQSLWPISGQTWFIPLPAELVCAVGAHLSPIERRAFVQLGEKLGFRQIFLIDKVLSAAVGEGWDVFTPTGRLVVYFGAGNSFISLISTGGKVRDVNLEFGWQDVIERLRQYLRQKQHILTSWQQAYQVVQEVSHDQDEVVVRGFDLVNKQLVSVKLASAKIRQLIMSWTDLLVNQLTEMVADLPAEFLPDISRQGLLLTGSGVGLVNLEKVMVEKLKIPVTKAAKPDQSVITGLGRLLNDKPALSKLALRVE